MTADKKPVPEPVLYLAYAVLTGEADLLDTAMWFAIALAGDIQGLSTREEAARAVLLKAARNGVTRVCR